MKPAIHLTGAALLAAVSLLPAPVAQASSHSDAPLIKLDPQANLTVGGP